MVDKTILLRRAMYLLQKNNIGSLLGDHFGYILNAIGAAADVVGDDRQRQVFIGIGQGNPAEEQSANQCDSKCREIVRFAFAKGGYNATHG